MRLASSTKTVKGVLGTLDDSGQLNSRPPCAGGDYAPCFSALFFPCEAVASVRQTRPGDVPKGRPAASPASISGRFPSQQASLTRDGVLTSHASTGMDWTEKAGHEEDRRKRKA